MGFFTAMARRLPAGILPVVAVCSTRRTVSAIVEDFLSGTLPRRTVRAPGPAVQTIASGIKLLGATRRSATLRRTTTMVFADIPSPSDLLVAGGQRFFRPSSHQPNFAVLLLDLDDDEAAPELSHVFHRRRLSSTSVGALFADPPSPADLPVLRASPATTPNFAVLLLEFDEAARALSHVTTKVAAPHVHEFYKRSNRSKFSSASVSYRWIKHLPSVLTVGSLSEKILLLCKPATTTGMFTDGDIDETATPSPQAPSAGTCPNYIDETATPSPQPPPAGTSPSYIDETSALQITDAQTFVKLNPMLLQKTVLGSGAIFWRLCDKKAARMIRSLAKTLRRQHEKGCYIVSPLLIENVMVTSSGDVKLKDVVFDDEDFSLERVKQDYKYMANLIKQLITFSVGVDGLTKIPSDFNKFLQLLESDKLEERDEFRIENHCSLLPMSIRSDAFLMMYNHITGVIASSNCAVADDIISKIPYQSTWFATAGKNTEISKWFRYRRYKDTPRKFLDLNRNVRSHHYEHSALIKIEEALYGEWPDLLVEMQEQLHINHELENTDIESKFGN